MTSTRPATSTRLDLIRSWTRPSAWHRPTRLGHGPLREMRLLLARHRRLVAVGLVLAGLWVTVRSAAPPAPATLSILVAARDLPAGRTLVGDDLRSGSWPADQVPDGRLRSAAGRVLASAIRAGEPVTDARVLGPGLLTGLATGLVAVPVRLGDAAAGSLVRAGDRVDVLASDPSSTVSSNWTTTSAEPDPADDGTGTGTGTGKDTAAGLDTGTGTGTGTERVAANALVLAAPGTDAADTDWSTTTGSSPSGGGLGGGGLDGGGLGGLTGTGTSAGAASGSSAGLVVLAVPSFEAGRLTAAQSSRYLGIVVLPAR